jgi:hypothetical protein
MIAEPSPALAPPRPLWPWRIASWVATAAAVLLLGFVIAHWGWRWLGPAPPPAAVTGVPERWAGVIASAPLFGQPAAPTATLAPNAPTTLQGDTRLLGVFAEPGGAGYALFHLGERGPVLVKAGAELGKDVVLLEVRPDGVRIRDRGELRDIELRARASALRIEPAGRVARAACAPPAGYKGPVYRLNAELLTGIASQPESWKALLVPVPGGLAVRDGSGFAAMLGMKAGDRMAQANGIALAGVDDVLVAFVRPLVASQPVHVAGTRDGKPAGWLFLNAGACPG